MTGDAKNSKPADVYALIAMLENPHLPRGDADQRCLSYEVQEDSIELPEALTSRYKVVRKQSKNTDDAVLAADADAPPETKSRNAADGAKRLSDLVLKLTDSPMGIPKKREWGKQFFEAAASVVSSPRARKAL